MLDMSLKVATSNYLDLDIDLKALEVVTHVFTA